MKRFLPASLALLTFLATWGFTATFFRGHPAGCLPSRFGSAYVCGSSQPYVQVFTKLGTAPVAGASLALAVVVSLCAKRWLLPVQLVAFAAGLLGTVQVLKTRLPYLPQGGINGTGYFPHYNTMPSGHAAMILVATVPLMAALSATKLPRIFKRIAFVWGTERPLFWAPLRCWSAPRTCGLTCLLPQLWHCFWAYLLLPLQQVQYKEIITALCQANPDYLCDCLGFATSRPSSTNKQ